PAALHAAGLERAESRLDGGLALEHLGLVAQDTRPAQPVDGPVARGRRDPRARVRRDAALGARLESDDERVLDRLLGEVEVAEHADERRDRPTLLRTEDLIDGRLDRRGGARGDSVAAAPDG